MISNPLADESLVTCIHQAADFPIPIRVT
jgi:hypothetical protein